MTEIEILKKKMTNLTEQWIMTKNLSERAHLEMYKARGEKVRLEKENAQLKELLKECQGSIATLLSKRITEVNGIKQEELLAKINQVLGGADD